jgi:hypothetical protein
MGNPDFINGSGNIIVITLNYCCFPPHLLHVYFSGVSVLHYLQSVLPNVAVGGEVAYQYGSGIPGGGIAVISGVGRYTGI